MTSSDVIGAIQSEQIEQPAGRIEGLKSETNLRVIGEARSAEEFGKIRLNTRGGAPNFKPVTLSEIARIEEGTADIRQISRFNGMPAVGLGIVKQHGANAVEVSKNIRDKLGQLKKSLMPGFHVDLRLDTTEYIRSSVHELNLALLASALLTSVVCFLFLGSWSSTLNIFFAIPTSIVGAFTFMHFMGFTLNTFTLLGLSLAIGIVVDDAIMMLENIVRHRELGKSRVQAAIDGANEITFAAIATTFAIGAIFIPVIFMKGVVGKFFFQYGIAVSVAVFLSLLEALTLTPMRCSQFLHSRNEKDGGSNRLADFVDRQTHRLADFYKRALAFCLDFRWSVLTLAVLFFISSLGFLSLLRKELIPSQDQSLFLLNLEAPVGSSIGATDVLFSRAEQILKTVPEVKDVYSTIGNYQGNNIVNAGVIYVMLQSLEERSKSSKGFGSSWKTPGKSQRQLMTEVRKTLADQLPGVTVFTQDLSLTGYSVSRGFPIEFTLEGPNWEKLKTLSAEVALRLNQSKFIEDLHSDFRDGMPEIHIIPDRIRSVQRGVSSLTIAQEVGNLVGGVMLNANTQYPKESHRYSIRVKGEGALPADLKALRLGNDRGSEGSLVPLGQVARIEETRGPQVISRVNRIRAISMYANLIPGMSQQEALGEILRVGKEILPEAEGYHLTPVGSAKAFDDAFGGLQFALILGVVIAYMILASQFNSFLHPISVLVALPFSLSGAFASLYFTGQSLSLFSMIGLVLLMGIVKKNSILLVDFTNQKKAQGLSTREALLSACPIRLRPILMTSVATVAGAIPEAVQAGAGAETRVPMAVCIIGGVLVSTLLTLFVVPCVYSLLQPRVTGGERG